MLMKEIKLETTSQEEIISIQVSSEFFCFVFQLQYLQFSVRPL